MSTGVGHIALSLSPTIEGVMIKLCLSYNICSVFFVIKKKSLFADILEASAGGGFPPNPARHWPRQPIVRAPSYIHYFHSFFLIFFTFFKILGFHLIDRILKKMMDWVLNDRKGKWKKTIGPIPIPVPIPRGTILMAIATLDWGWGVGAGTSTLISMKKVRSPT